MWRLKDKHYLTSEKGKVFSVDGGLDNEQRNIVVEQRNDKVHQRWRVVYVDEYEEEPTKGQMNKKFGVRVDEDFYVISALGPTHRYLDAINNNPSDLVIKSRNIRRTQVWYFHQKSLTFRTKYNNQSFNIKNSGKSDDMQIYYTNSKWFQIFRYEDS
jgi:hypothetical protein